MASSNLDDFGGGLLAGFCLTTLAATGLLIAYAIGSTNGAENAHKEAARLGYGKIVDRRFEWKPVTAERQ